jgi:hypothetical protein
MGICGHDTQWLSTLLMICERVKRTAIEEICEQLRLDVTGR